MGSPRTEREPARRPGECRAPAISGTFALLATCPTLPAALLTAPPASFAVDSTASLTACGLLAADLLAAGFVLLAAAFVLLPAAFVLFAGRLREVAPAAFAFDRVRDFDPVEPRAFGFAFFVVALAFVSAISLSSSWWGALLLAELALASAGALFVSRPRPAPSFSSRLCDPPLPGSSSSAVWPRPPPSLGLNLR